MRRLLAMGLGLYLLGAVVGCTHTGVCDCDTGCGDGSCCGGGAPGISTLKPEILKEMPKGDVKEKTLDIKAF